MVIKSFLVNFITGSGKFLQFSCILLSKDRFILILRRSFRIEVYYALEVYIDECLSVLFKGR